MKTHRTLAVSTAAIVVLALVLTACALFGERNICANASKVSAVPADTAPILAIKLLTDEQATAFERFAKDHPEAASLRDVADDLPVIVQVNGSHQQCVVDHDDNPPHYDALRALRAMVERLPAGQTLPADPAISAIALDAAIFVKSNGETFHALRPSPEDIGVLRVIREDGDPFAHVGRVTGNDYDRQSSPPHVTTTTTTTPATTSASPQRSRQPAQTTTTTTTRKPPRTTGNN